LGRSARHRVRALGERPAVPLRNAPWRRKNDIRVDDYAEKHANSQRRFVVASSSATMRRTTSCFHMHGTVATAIIGVTLFAVITILRNTRASGRRATSAVERSKLKYTSGAVRMHTTSRNWRTRHHSAPRSVPRADRGSTLVKTVTRSNLAVPMFANPASNFRRERPPRPSAAGGFLHWRPRLLVKNEKLRCQPYP
jgi:hypothetical protein